MSMNRCREFSAGFTGCRAIVPAVSVILFFAFFVLTDPCDAGSGAVSAGVMIFSCLNGASVEIDGIQVGKTVQGSWAGFKTSPGPGSVRISDPQGDFMDFTVTISPLVGETVEIIHVPGSAATGPPDPDQIPGVHFHRLKGGRP